MAGNRGGGISFLWQVNAGPGMASRDGRKRVEVATESVTVLIPAGVHDEMILLIQSEKAWFDRQEFIKEAIREKLQRHRALRREGSRAASSAPSTSARTA